ncbi:MAG: hypothetical protein ACRYG8_55495 [Janthinobacterium lividum]
MTAFSLPWDDLPAPQLRPPKSAEEKTERRPPTRRQKAATKQARQDQVDARAVTADTGVIWQWWHLVVHGPAEEVASFAAAARGPGFIPWRIDDGGFEDDVLAFAFGGPARPDLSVADCRILARQFRDAIEARRARNERQADRSTRCPLDLQALLPVPAALLPLGAAHPDAEAWLRRHWGVLDQPRHAEVLEDRTAGKRLPQGHLPLVYGFFTEGPAPEAARLALQERWPMLVFRLDRRPMT